MVDSGRRIYYNISKWNILILGVAVCAEIKEVIYEETHNETMAGNPVSGGYDI